MDTVYKGIRISIDRGCIDQFEIEDLNNNYHRIEDAEAAIDRHLKKENKFTRIPVIFRRWDNKVKFGEITSVVMHGYVWISITGGSREKVMIGSGTFCCNDNEQNREIVAEFHTMVAEADRLRDASRKLLSSIDASQLEETVKKFSALT
ncbi:hypothetical protein KAR91_18905 [Candidatus Pacearchaeota archaeon]|nr:hypothetical protein [Candidatus Pacearchaeota archaeon]